MTVLIVIALLVLIRLTFVAQQVLETLEEVVEILEDDGLDHEDIYLPEN